MRCRVSSDGIGNDHPAALLITNEMESEEANAGPEGCQKAGKVKWLSASSRWHSKMCCCMLEDAVGGRRGFARHGDLKKAL